MSPRWTAALVALLGVLAAPAAWACPYCAGREGAGLSGLLVVSELEVIEAKIVRALTHERVPHPCARLLRIVARVRSASQRPVAGPRRRLDRLPLSL